MQAPTIAELEAYGSFHDLANYQVSNWLVGGATALFFYDWLLCFDREVEYVWLTRWSFGKVLFAMHRYPMVALIIYSLYATVASSTRDNSIAACRMYDDATTYGTIVIFAIIQATLIVRVYALYRKSLRIIVPLIALYIGCNSTMIVLYHYYRNYIKYVKNPLAASHVFVCVRTCPSCSHWSTYTYLPMLFLDTMILLLTVRQSYVSTRHRSAAPTMTILYRDGIIYFVVIFSIMLINVLFLALTTPSMCTWFLGWMRPLMSSMASRLLFNLHGQIHVVNFKDIWLPSITVPDPMATDKSVLFMNSQAPEEDLELKALQRAHVALRRVPVEVYARDVELVPPPSRSNSSDVSPPPELNPGPDTKRSWPP